MRKLVLHSKVGSRRETRNGDALGVDFELAKREPKDKRLEKEMKRREQLNSFESCG